MTDVIISRQGFGENDELPATVTKAAPGQIVVVPDSRTKHVVFVDGEQVGVVFDESAAKLERGAFAVWAPKRSERRDGIAGFRPTLEEAALLAAGRTAKPADERPDAWTVAGPGTLLHRFTQADKDGRALCNKSFRPHRYGNGYAFKTKAEQKAGEYAHLYRFCPRCEAK